MEPVCELRAVRKSFQGRAALDGVDLALAPGEVTVITGRSGSGKSTLLNIAGLLERPDAGSVHLFGRPAPRVGSGQATRLLRRRLGYLFQNYALIDNETVHGNLRVAQAYVAGTAREKAGARERALDSVGLPGFGERRVYGLSGGEQQRVAIARLLLKPCDLVLADEPTGSLEAGNRDEVLALLAGFTGRGVAGLAVTHDQNVAARADRVVRLPDPTAA